jgi:asparagine synthase (glutamine-hydrolysing)
LIEHGARAAGLRVRLPFLDRDFVEFAATIPTALKVRGGRGMLPLRAVLADRLPPRLVPPPSGPRPQAWLSATLAAMVPVLLLGPRFDARGIVSRLVLRGLWEEHLAGTRDHSHRLWSLLMLERWFREFIDGDGREQPLEYAVLTPRTAA